jgi:hypothetical protein
MSRPLEYRWSHPTDWLADLIDESDESELADIAHALASKLDGDQIQDLFADEMEADGYFRPLARPAEDA